MSAATDPVTSRNTERTRLAALDRIKAAAIVAVVCGHSGFISARGIGRSVWDVPLTNSWVRFHVPAFLLVSGLLYARSNPIPLRDVGRRILRILLPYAVANLAAFALVKLPSSPPRESLSELLLRVLVEFATASAFGIYYYIAILLLCTLCIWPLSRLSRREVFLVLCLLVFVTWLSVPVRLGLRPSGFWHVRLPIYRFLLGYFLIGWLAGLSLDAVRNRLRELRYPLIALCAPIAALCIVENAGFAVPGLSALATLPSRILYTFSVVLLIACLFGERPASAPVRFLSETSLLIYLFHYIFLRIVDPFTSELPDLLRILSQIAVGLGGAVSVALAGRKLLGRDRARRWLGA